MMITSKENSASSFSQPIQSNITTNPRLYSTISYDYHQYNPWGKPSYPSFYYPQSSSYPIGTISSTPDGSSSMETINKSNTSNFYRRHTESALPTSTTPSIYSTSLTNHPSSSSFNYSPTTTHYPPVESYFDWNHGSSLIRTHSDYPLSSTTFSRFNPMNPGLLVTNKSTENLSQSNSTNPYPSYFNMIPPINFSLPPPMSIPSNSNTISSRSKRSISSVSKKRPRLTAQLRHEILQLKANKPTIFVWEIQQNLLQNGICTAQTLPTATMIQKILNESISHIKQEPKLNVDTVPENVFPKTSPVTICLSPSQSPALSDGETGSECSICLEHYRSGQEVSILSCSHEYHSSCIKEWMLKNRSCPMCRKDIHNQPQFVTLLI